MTTTSENPAVTAQHDVLMFTYHVLVSYAERRKTTTYGRLYDILAAEFDWPKRVNGNSWQKRLPLAQLGTLNKENGEPALASLVRKNEPGRPIGVGYKTAHLNCHGITLVGHEGGCACETCEAVVNAAGRREARLCFEHFNRA
jgi:hypothetical protein